MRITLSRFQAAASALIMTGCWLFACPDIQIAHGSPVLLKYSGTVQESNCNGCQIVNPFGGFLNAGDLYTASIYFETSKAILTNTISNSATYELAGAHVSFLVNGFEFTAHPTAPVLAFVHNGPSVD